MRNFLFISIILMMSAIMISCKRTSFSDRLQVAQSLIFDHPDSAMSILDSIDYTNISKNNEKALYGLLFTMARDKNHLYPLNLDLISFADDYYTKKGDVKHSKLSSYYLGRAQYLNKNYTASIVSYLKSKEIAEKDSDYFWMGMNCRGISDICTEINNHGDEIIYSRKEFDYLDKSGVQPYINYALTDYACALHNHGDYESAVLIADQALDSARAYTDNNLEYIALSQKVHSLVASRHYSEALPLATQNCRSEFANEVDSAYLSVALAGAGKTQESEKILKSLNDTCNSLLINMARAKIYETLGQYDKAYAEHRYMDSVSDLSYKESTRHNITDAIDSYLSLNNKLQNNKIRSVRTIMWLSVIASILIICLLIAVIFYHHREQRKKIKENVLLAEQIKENLERKSLLPEYAQSDSEITDNNSNQKPDYQHDIYNITLIKDLMSSKYALLEDLFRINIEPYGSSAAKRKISETVNKLKKEMTVDEKKIVELGNIVDKTHNNIFSNLKKDLPSLKEIDYLLFLYNMVGFSASVIMMLLNEDNISNVYNRKKRLKAKIKSLPPEQIEKYKDFI